jgi:tetratricopeptide (TPR) repeat protein
MNGAKIGIALVIVLAACAEARSTAKRNTTPLPAQCTDAVQTGSARDAQLTRVQARLKQPQATANDFVAAGYAWVGKARADAEPARYRNAEACARAALARNPSDAAASALHGMVLLEDHRFREARALALELIARDPRNVTAYGLLSDAALELGELDAAIDAGQRMVDAKPSLLSYGRAAHLRWLQGDVAGAKRLYERAIAAGKELPDREPRAWMIVQAALVFWHAGDYAGADAGFDLALREQPEYAPALEGKGRVALSRGDANAAVQWLARAQRKNPLVETSWLLGDAYRRIGDEAAAAREYERVERDGNAHDPRTLALFYAVKNQRADEAVRLARLDYAERKDIYAKDVLAFALYRSGDIAQARALSREVIAAGAPDARLLYRAGLIAMGAGEREQGNALVTRARHMNSGFDPLYLEEAINEHASR